MDELYSPLSSPHIDNLNDFLTESLKHIHNRHSSISRSVTTAALALHHNRKRLLDILKQSDSVLVSQIWKRLHANIIKRRMQQPSNHVVTRDIQRILFSNNRYIQKILIFANTASISSLTSAAKPKIHHIVVRTSRSVKPFSNFPKHCLLSGIVRAVIHHSW